MHRRLSVSHESPLKSKIAELLESRAVELAIVFLVLCDVVLVLLEAGVEEHILCIGGRVAVCPTQSLYPDTVGGDSPHFRPESGRHARHFLQGGRAEGVLPGLHRGGSAVGEPSQLAKSLFAAPSASTSLLQLVDAASGRLKAGEALRAGPAESLSASATSASASLLQLVDAAGSRLKAGGALRAGPDMGMPWQFFQAARADRRQVLRARQTTPRALSGRTRESQRQTGLRAAPEHGEHPHSPGRGGLCDHPGEPILVCDTREGHHAEHFVHVCHTLSVTILCLFVLELSLKWWADPAGFCGNFYHKLDLIVTLISLLLDTIVIAYIEAHEERARSGRDMEALSLCSALIIFSRMWRVLRICHGIFEEIHSVQELDEENKRLRQALESQGLDGDGNNLRDSSSASKTD